MVLVVSFRREAHLRQHQRHGAGVAGRVEIVLLLPAKSVEDAPAIQLDRGNLCGSEAS